MELVKKILLMAISIKASIKMVDLMGLAHINGKLMKVFMKVVLRMA